MYQQIVSTKTGKVFLETGDETNEIYETNVTWKTSKTTEANERSKKDGKGKKYNVNRVNVTTATNETPGNIDGLLERNILSAMGEDNRGAHERQRINENEIEHGYKQLALILLLNEKNSHQNVSPNLDCCCDD